MMSFLRTWFRDNIRFLKNLHRQHSIPCNGWMAATKRRWLARSGISKRRSPRYGRVASANGRN
jgi:hypothetical protein